MRILLINSTDDKGGAARLTLMLKEGLEKHGQLVSLFVKHKTSSEKNVFEIGKPNIFLKKISALSNKILGYDIVIYFQGKVRTAIASDINFFNNNNLINSKEFKEADIIHCHNLHSNYFNLKSLEKISKIKPVIWTLHDMWAITPHEAWVVKDSTGAKNFTMEIKPHLKWNNRKYLLKTKQNIYSKINMTIVVTCKWLMDEMSNSILRDKKRVLVYNGIDETIFKPCDKRQAREQLGLPLDKTIITFMANGGKNNEQKGWPYAAETIKHYAGNKDILFLCVGGKETESDLKNDNINYIAYIKDDATLRLYYCVSDIFLNPSMAEAFGLMIVQAMACGTPVVTFPVGIANEAIIHKETGYIANYQDSKDLILGVEYILGLSEEKIKRMGDLSRKKVLECFTLDTMIKNYIQLYKDIIHSEK